MASDYFKYRIPYDLIYSKLNSLGPAGSVKQLNFFIDLPAIARGLFSRTTQYKEINSYLETRQMPTVMIDELRVFLNTIYKNFKNYNPKFILFFDNGKDLQTKSIDSDYKSDRSSQYNKILEDEEREIHRAIKNYYFDTIEKVMPRTGLCSVVYDRQYEMDCLPHYCISKGHCNSTHPNTVNLILTSDKDLLQTCKFKNTFVLTSIYVNKQIKMNLWDNDNCIEYIYPKFLRGILKAEHLPLLLAIAGDKADNIQNIEKGFGIAKAVELVSNNNIPGVFTEAYSLPIKLEPYKKKIINNLKLTHFDLQIQRIPDQDLILLSSKLSII
jgi:5'-3' exonuclease